jgi:[acyl-carrier-protein] S-malonyltransferase
LAFEPRVTGAPGLALLFPGQGSQHVGMSRALAEAFPLARTTLAEADEVLGFPLSRLMWEGPEAELVLTRNAQPAILAHSVAVWRLVQDRLGPVSMAAGHSLGEFSAHVAAGSLSFADALSVVRLRGELMFEAGKARAGTMSAVLGMEDSLVEAVCADASGPGGTVVVAANYNSAGQVVISGDVEAVARAGELAKERGAKRVVPLSVSGAFHSPLMRPAEAGLEERLVAARLGDPGFPVYSNVTTAPVTTGEDARRLLVRQLTEPVRWAGLVAAMVKDGARKLVELGPGSVLTGLNKRNARDVEARAIGEPDDIAALD